MFDKHWFTETKVIDLYYAYKYCSNFDKHWLTGPEVMDWPRFQQSTDGTVVCSMPPTNSLAGGIIHSADLITFSVLDMDLLTCSTLS